MTKLKHPKNVRETNHCCCASCKYLSTFEMSIGSTFARDRIEHEWMCKRADEPVCDPGQIENTICDGYKRKSND